MKKRECAIVQDLLVLYEDDALQEESMRMIEEHIRGCEECMGIYENTGKKLVVAGEGEPPEKEQDDAAARILKKLSRKTTYKSMAILGAVAAGLLVVILLVNGICNRITGNNEGIVDTLYAISTDKIEVTELYELKNGDIYCTLKTEEPIGVYQVGDWQVPNNEYWKDTDEAVSELYFRRRAFWEYNTVEKYEVTAVFATKRQGTLKESGEEITQQCSQIYYRGMTENDRLVIWQKGQTVKAAPEDIERKAILEYVREGRVEKAIQECEALGWDSNEIIAELYGQEHDISSEYGRVSGDEVTFSNDYDTVFVDEW